MIRLDVEPVISQLNFAQATQSARARSRRSPSEVRARSSSCGRVKAWRSRDCSSNTTNASTVRVPGLGDLPIVGSWFSANSIETVETETIVLGDSRAGLASREERGNRSTRRPRLSANDPEFYLLGRIEGKLGREFRATKGEQDPLNLMKHFQSEQQWVVGPHGHAD